MDPHSRRSQFNNRAPKSGPPTQNRFMDPPHAKPTLKSKKHPSGTPFTESSPSTSESASSSLLIRRPIATNSRVKQDEKYRKDMYLVFVNNALQQKANGIAEPFEELVNQFNLKRTPSDGAPHAAQMRLWILALSHVVSRLERTHSALVEAIINMPWTAMDTAIVKSYTVFIGMLLSARPEYLSLTLSKIAQGFTHQSGIQALDAAMPEGSSSPLTRRTIYDRLHYLLRHLLSLIPTLTSTLQPLLVRNFPHKRQNQLAQSTYIRNLLRVSGYCPELADKILATIVDRAIQIDVEIQVELEELEEEEAAQDQDVFEIDPFDTVVGQEGDDSDSDNDDEDDGDNLSDLSSDAGDMDDIEQTTDGPLNVHHIQDMVKKLDAILTLIFDYFHRTHAAIPSVTTSTNTTTSTLPPLPPLTPPTLSPRSSSPFSFDPKTPTTPDLPTPPPLIPTPKPPSPSHAKSFLHAQFHSLLSIFDRTILPTFKSRYTQFLLFWYASLDPEFADLFQGLLVSRALLEHDAPAVTRAAAASYIGSFVSRAQFVEREGTRRVVGVLCEFLRSHLEGFDGMMVREGVAPGMAHHSVFYAVAQAVFLIFCFRWRDLLEEEDVGEDELIGGGKAGKKWMAELGVVQRVVMSELNPLKVCSANVVMQFARVAQATDFIYCYTIVESNKRSEYSSNNTDGRVSSNHRPVVHPVLLGNNINAELNTFFPFDPYKLPKSNAYIQGVYREWASVAIDEEEDEEEEEEEEEDETGGDVEVREGERTFGGYWDIPPSGTRGDDSPGGLGESLGAMSISPVRPGLQASAVCVP